MISLIKGFQNPKRLHHSDEGVLYIVVVPLKDYLHLMQTFLYNCSIGFGTRKPDKDNFPASVFPIVASESC